MSPRHDNESTLERFNFAYLPPPVADSFREALACYRQGLLRAYGAMCRLTAQAMFADLGESAKLRIFDQVEEIAQLANVDDRTYRTLRNILFDNDEESLTADGALNRETAAILLETMHDILHQAYIRRELLRKKLRMRRYFATQEDQDEALDTGAADNKVAPLKRPTGTDD